MTFAIIQQTSRRPGQSSKVYINVFKETNLVPNFQQINRYVHLKLHLKCRRPNCGNCIYLIECSSFQFKNGTVFRIKCSMTCTTKSIIYVITCRRCNENYIGQTGLTIRQRMTIYRQQIRNPRTRMIPLSGHIN